VVRPSLSNADLKETIDLLRIVSRADGVAPLRRERAHHQRHAGQGGGGERIVDIVDKELRGGDGRGRDPRGERDQAQEYGIEISPLPAGPASRRGLPRTTITETVRDAAGNALFDRTRPITVTTTPTRPRTCS